MHILSLSEIFPPTHGGSGRWLWEVAVRLDPSEITIITHLQPSAKTFDYTHNLDVRRIPLKSSEWGIRSLQGLRYYWQTMRFVRRTIKESRANKDTMMHCARCIPEGFVGYLMHRLYQTPYLCFVHGEDIETAKNSRELSWIATRSLKSAQILICNSQNTATLLKRDWSVPEHKIHVVHPGVDTDYFTPAAYCPQTRERLGWDNRPVLLTVGRLQKRKGHDNVIKALPLILRKHPDLLYCIVGQGEELSHLQKLVTQQKVTESVQFITTACDEDLLAAYQQCNLFILANRTVNN
ncbi:MAG: glycosyltransferase family 4 protein, partial [Gammaproteobacteria bacterium]